MDDETLVGEGLADGGGVFVAFLGGKSGVGEDVVDVDAGVEGGGVERVEKGMHFGVGDCCNIIPSKRRTGEGEVECGVVGGEDGEDEGGGVGGG